VSAKKGGAMAETDTINKARILIVDDHPIVRQALGQLINESEDLIFAGEAADAPGALACIGTIQPALAMIDISLKGISGIELTKQIVAQYPNLPVLILSVHDEPIYVERALQVGAKGYLVKSEATTQSVLNAIRQVLRGFIYLSEETRKSTVAKDGLAQAGINTETLTALSEREMEVFQIIAQGYTTREIANELNVSVKTIESHYANIKNKFQLKNSHELIRHAVRSFL
jgi:DNA-binding NarL/FixJ family response regulator